MVDHIPAMQDMRRTKEDNSKDVPYAIPSVDSAPSYPYGLCISLQKPEIEKLDLDMADVRPGDMIHLHCMAIVTSVSESASPDNSNSDCRLELQITHISAEDEALEDEEEEAAEESVTSKLYR